ncbi:MAG: hypothetical protein ACE5IE_03050 [Dehalococcoidia bacterium]
MAGMKAPANNFSTTNDMPARARIEMGRNMALLFGDPGTGPWDYPAGRIQKGLVLAHGNRDLAEEGIGFGVPLLKLGPETIFPGCAHITTEKDSDTSIVEVNYDLNLVERMEFESGRSIDSSAFYKMRDYFSWLHRRYPPLRGVITRASNSLKLAYGIESRFKDIATVGIANVVYLIHAREGTVHVSVNLSKLKKDGCTEIIIANEQGASHFDQYRDSNGVTIIGNAIGTWNETFADEASLIDSHDNIVFTLQKVEGARMFRGRELVAGRLAWSGLNYMIPRDTGDFAYDIRIGAIT